MRFDILTLHPQLLEGPFAHSIVKRALDKGLVEIHIHNLRDYSTSKQKQADDYPFGGAAGMVMMIQPIDDCIAKLTQERKYNEIIYLCPDAPVLKQAEVNKLSMGVNYILLCGHYKGIDQRVRDHFITKEISIGDFVLSGGELPAALLVDAIVRLIPGAITDVTSALTDSFQDDLLSPPVYTRPADYKGFKVPEVLLNGNHKLIEEWQHEKAVEKTKAIRPDLLD
ncbi:MAG: tRNA (guanosine(37)-N1)-methyltransferase TrmD [Bacteroidetes bacterium]|nr:tRNA (guanosine(37)-N1)-methyltransferase TrmD [Bacteroidota bacterium]